jgi:ABC-type polysaccharide/polyol phosphate transport system ATPase subunit
MAAIKKYLKGKTMIFVSHSAYQVRKLCEKAIVLDEGRVVYIGETEEALEYYENEIVKRVVTK